MRDEDSLQQNKQVFRLSDSISAICPNVHCPHRAALEREQYTSLQLTAANDVLGEKQRYFAGETERLAAEVRVKKEQLQQLHDIATLETTRREEMEKQLVELRRLLHAERVAAQSTAAVCKAEMETVQQEKKLLFEQVLQLQKALNDMVLLNKTLQFALHSHNGKDVGQTAADVSVAEEELHLNKRCTQGGVQLSPQSFFLSRGAVTNSPVSSLSQLPAPVAVTEGLPTSEEGRKENNIDSNCVHVNPDCAHLCSSFENNNSETCDDSNANLRSMRAVILELEALRGFLNSFEPDLQ